MLLTIVHELLASLYPDKKDGSAMGQYVSVDTLEVSVEALTLTSDLF